MILNKKIETPKKPTMFKGVLCLRIKYTMFKDVLCLNIFPIVIL